MVRTIHTDVDCAMNKLAETRTVSDRHGMKRFGRAFVLHLRSHFVRYVLDQSSAQENVEALNSIADRQHRFLRGEAMFKQREIGLLAFAVRRRSLWMRRSVKA